MPRWNAYDNEHVFGIAPENLAPYSRGLGEDQTGERLLPAIYDAERQGQEDDLRQQQYISEIAANRMVGADLDAEFSQYGAIVRPKEETLRGYKHALREANGARNIQFSPSEFNSFDNLVLKQNLADDIGQSMVPYFNETHPDYERYAPLRRNLAVLRNYLFVHYPPDRSISPDGAVRNASEDENLTLLRQMATFLGDKIAGGKEPPPIAVRFADSMGQVFSGKNLAPIPNDFLAAANVPDKGIGVMYDALIEEQKRKPAFSSLPFGPKPRKWNLTPRRQTAFSDDNMNQFALYAIMDHISGAFDGVTKNLHTLEHLTAHDKAVSIQHGRDILRNLRITMDDASKESDLNKITDNVRDEAATMLRASTAFRSAMTDLVSFDPSQVKNPVLMEAASAIHELDFRVKLETRRILLEAGEGRAAKIMEKRIANIPQQFKTGKSITELLGKLDKGLEEQARLEKTLPGFRKTDQLPAAHKAFSDIQGSYTSADITSANHAELARKIERVQEEQSRAADAARNAPTPPRERGF